MTTNNLKLVMNVRFIYKSSDKFNMNANFNPRQDDPGHVNSIHYFNMINIIYYKWLIKNHICLN